ncbi:MAG: gliding motility-associated C-terminal domain-containing protein [Bacteroidales bacterium]|nr:gliding motility-associated C-terminal domain-containing protein [Bacteroidales bacterium]
MTADQPSLGTGLWSLISGTGDPEDETDNLTIIRNLSKGINTFLWTIYNGPIAANGTCILQDSINIEVVDIFVPEGFSPNNDNFNNSFKITGLDLSNQTAELTIVNGAGAKVFSTTNREGQEWSDWDGKNSRGQDLPEGTYYYLLKMVSNGGGGQVFKKSGFIILKRY